MRCLTLVALIIFQCENLCAQQIAFDTATEDHRLSPLEKKQINDAIKRSTFWYYYAADSCSRKGDSINASAFFLKVNPYVLFFDDVTPDSIDLYLRKRYKLTVAAREKYVADYTTAYNSKKSAAYERMKAMGDEDRKVRNDLAKCRDNRCAEKAALAMHITDSVHAAFFYEYVNKNGWPSLADGSLYACLLGLHDMAHTGFYFPYVQKALLAGQMEPNAFQLFRYWESNGRGYSYKLALFKSKGRYYKIDVTPLYNNINLPDSTWQRIVDIVKSHCPVKIFYVAKVRDKKAFKDWTNEAFIAFYAETDILSKTAKNLWEYNCNMTSYQALGFRDGLWSVYWEDEGAEEKPRMWMYILYDRGDAQPSEFDEIKRENKFTTHAIHFNFNKATIQPDGLDYLEQLAEWLDDNTNVKLEIDGHTDNVGTPEYNMKLSRERANEVKKQLMQFGIKGDRLTTKGFGATIPLQSDDTPEGKAANRRVEFIRR